MSVSCRVSSRIRHALLALTIVGIAACAGDRPTGPDASLLAAKGGGGGGPKVKAAEPDSATQDTTLNVRVIGSGFEDGSVVKLLLAGESTPKILTNSTSFVDGNNLIANITIAVDADIALYDIEVTPPRGRPGVGSELFSVKKKGGKPGDDVSNYALTDLGLGAASDISETGIVVGGSDGEAVLWKTDGTPVPLGLAGGTRTFASAINGMGTQIVGEMWDGIQQAVRWDIDGGTVTATTVLQPLVGHNAANPSGINDLGQVVGQSYPDDDLHSQLAVLWEANGTPRDLGELSDRSGSWARAINNAGHVVGRSGIGTFGEPRAVLWILEGETVTILDLTANSDNSGDNHATSVTEPSGGFVQISGYTSIAGQQRPTVWTVDLWSKDVTVTAVVRLEEGSGGGSAINNVGEVAVSSGVVWTPELNLVEALPTLSPRKCNTNARQLNNLGTVVGYSGVSKKGRCTRHAVLWTKTS